jgi:hypothetical protein
MLVIAGVLLASLGHPLSPYPSMSSTFSKRATISARRNCNNCQPADHGPKSPTSTNQSRHHRSAVLIAGPCTKKQVDRKGGRDQGGRTLSGRGLPPSSSDATLRSSILRRSIVITRPGHRPQDAMLCLATGQHTLTWRLSPGWTAQSPASSCSSSTRRLCAAAETRAG